MSVIQTNAGRYRAARKKLKSQMLDELSRILHYHRKYLALLLRASGRSVFSPTGIRFLADPHVSFATRRGRRKVYGQDLVPYLKIIWELASAISSVHLVVFIQANHDFLFRHPLLRTMPAQLKRQLRSIRHATIDRLLAPIRQCTVALRPDRRRPHASWLKKIIPVQPYHQKPTATLGYLEVDSVFHSGATDRGQFAVTLDATEITTGWTELVALPNLAQCWTVRALRRIVRRVPFTVRELHSDNGGEFINRRLYRYARQCKLHYTRSRAMHKNDSPFVESKNATLVRAYVGRRRYDTKNEVAILQQLMPKIALRHNLFMPTMKRDRSVPEQSRRRFTIQTPYHRLLASPQVTREQKQALRLLRRQTDYFRLAAEVDQLCLKLDQLHRGKYTNPER